MTADPSPIVKEPANTQDAARRILKERAEKLARATDDSTDEESLTEMTTFVLGTETFAIESSSVKEVVRAVDVTPIPLVPDHVLGLINLRGEIMMVVNILSLFGVDRDITGYGNLVVLGEERVEFALAVQTVKDVARFDLRTLTTPPPSISDAAREAVAGIALGTITILDAKNLINSTRLYLGEER